MKNQSPTRIKAITKKTLELLFTSGLALILGVVILSHQVKAEPEKFVTAFDYGGVDEITAPVRYYRKGYQVLVPNWGWTDCERSCRLTLRKFHFNNKVDALNPEKSESDLGILTFHIPFGR